MIKNRGVLDARTYEEPELVEGDMTGRIDPSRVDRGLTRKMLGDLSDGQIDEFLKDKDFPEYNELERDSLSSVANEFYNFKRDTKTELKNSGQKGFQDGPRLKEFYDGKLQEEAGRIEREYPNADFEGNSDIFSTIEGLREFGVTDEDALREIGKLQDKWQNKVYGR